MGREGTGAWGLPCVDELVAELLQYDNDPGGCVVVLGGGPDEADGV